MAGGGTCNLSWDSSRGPFPEAGRGQTGSITDKEVGSNGRTEAPGSLLWLSTKLPQALPNTEKVHPEGLVLTRRWAL